MLNRMQLQAIEVLIDEVPVEDEGIPIELVYDWLKNDEEFRKVYEQRYKQLWTKSKKDSYEYDEVYS